MISGLEKVISVPEAMILGRKTCFQSRKTCFQCGRCDCRPDYVMSSRKTRVTGLENNDFRAGKRVFRAKSVFSVPESMYAGPEHVISGRKNVFSGRESVIALPETLIVGRQCYFRPANVFFSSPDSITVWLKMGFEGRRT